MEYILTNYFIDHINKKKCPHDNIQVVMFTRQCPSTNIATIGGIQKNEKIQQNIVVLYDRFYHNNSHIERFP
jgi:hypothetical protein